MREDWGSKLEHFNNFLTASSNAHTRAHSHSSPIKCHAPRPHK